ncbi:MAG: precorrin-2 C(20)-methyltransferase [Fusobacteriaceae bacterium]
MSSARFYGIGVGVGDPEMITLKAIRAFKELDVVVLPEAKKTEGSTAYEIAKEYLKEGAETMFLEFPMLKSVEARKEFRKNNADMILEHLKAGKKVGFLTIGDPMTYSTYVYILEYLDGEIPVQTIPGISSFSDMSSRFNLPLVMGEESLKVISLNSETDVVSEINSADNIVFMKVSRNFEKLRAGLEATKNLENVIMVSNCGKETQAINFDLKKLEEADIPYFTTLILKKGGINQWKKFIS